MTSVERFKELLIRANGDAAIALRGLALGGSASRLNRRIGQSGSSASVRRYHCNGCGERLGTDSARYPPTVRETERNARHLSRCVEWARWDEAASVLVGSVSQAAMGVALDAALILASELE